MTDTAVTLFGHWICPFSVRVEFALAQRSIPYTVVDVPPSAVRPRGFVVPEEFLKHSPKREIPMIRIGDRHLADSIPILEWLEAEFTGGPLLPSDEASADLVRERVQWIDTNLYRPMIGVYYGTEPDLIRRSSSRFGDALRTIASWLGDSEWLVGDSPTLAEALMVAVYVRLDGLRRLGLTAEIPSAISAHSTSCQALRGWSAAKWSPQQIDEFVWRFEKYRERQRASAAPVSGAVDDFRESL